MKNIIFLTTLILTITSCNFFGKKEIELIPVASDNKYEYIDREGKITINPQFEVANIHKEGLALVKSSGENTKYGFISEDGKFVISPKYIDATNFSEGIAWVVQKNSSPTAIDTKGKVLFKVDFAETVRSFSNGYAAFLKYNSEGKSKWGFLSEKGTVAINAQFDYVGNFSNEKCAVKNNKGKWGYINEKGLIEINYQFDYASSFNSDGYAIVSLSNKFGVIDEDGKYIINPQFSEMKFDGENYLIKQNHKYGWCDKDGKYIINPQFDRAFAFSGSNLAAVESSGKWGYINSEGKYEVNPQFEEAYPFDGDLALVESNNKYGFINEEGKFEINPQFEDVSYDYVNYIVYGRSNFNSVTSDFFNIDAILKSINIESPENLTFNSTFNNLMQKFNLSQNYLSTYSKIQSIFTDKKITKDASISFYVGGNAFEEVQYETGDGWYSYTNTENVFKGSNKINYFKYSINLFEKGYGKENDFIKEFETKLIGYTKNISKSTNSVKFYDNGNKIIKIYNTGYTVEISVYKLSDAINYEYLDENNSNYGTDDFGYSSESDYYNDYESESNYNEYGYSEVGD